MAQIDKQHFMVLKYVHNPALSSDDSESCSISEVLLIKNRRSPLLTSKDEYEILLEHMLNHVHAL